MAGKKRISQETFDDAVRENMEEFGMERAEAIKDAIDQFEMQGIDLSNIVTSSAGSGGEHPIVSASKRFVAAAVEEDSEAILEAILALQRLIPGDVEGKTMAGNAGVVEAAVSALDKHKANAQACIGILGLLQVVIVDNVNNRDKLKEPLARPGIVAVVECLEALPDEASVQEAGFRVLRVAATKSESIKATIMEYNCVVPMKEALQRHLNNAAVVQNVAGTIRTVTNADDWSTMVSKVFDTAKDIAKAALLPHIYSALRAHEADPEVLAELLAALKGCAVQHDIVKGMTADGGLDLALQSFQKHMEHAGLAARCMLLLANLAEDDDVKKTLCQGHAMPLMLAAMQMHQRSPRVIKAGFAAMASMALRMPDNTERMVEAGAVHSLTEGMRIHAKQSEVSRQGMIAIRNMVVRCPHHRDAFLAEGAEELIVAARDTHIKCGDAAFDCLRDLGCEYGGLGDMAGKGKNSAYVTCEDSLLSKKGQLNAGSSMVTWEEEDDWGPES